MCPNCFRTLQRETQQNKVKKFQRTTLALYIESLYRVSIPPLRGGGGGLLLHRQNWSPFSPVLTLNKKKAGILGMLALFLSDDGASQMRTRTVRLGSAKPRTLEAEGC